MKKKNKVISSFREDLNRKQKDPKFRKEYEKQGPLIDAAIKIAMLREKNHMTQAELADKLHTSQQQISRIECGDENVTYDTLLRIARVFHKIPQISFVSESKSKWGNT